MASTAIRLRFPERSRDVLDAGDPFAAVADGFRTSREVPAGRRGLALTLPPHGDGAIRFSLPGGFAAEVREHGLAGPGAVAGGAVAYPRADGTSYWAATPEGYEEWLLLDAAGRDWPAARWDVTGVTLRQAGSAVEVADEAGEARLVVRAPAAYGAAGQQVAAWLTVKGSTLELRVDAEGQVLVDPVWTATGSMTSAHCIAGMGVLASGKVMVVGGQVGGASSAAADQYDPTTDSWSGAGTLATARLRPALATLASGQALVIGGFNATTNAYLGTTELYNPGTSTWSAGPTMTFHRAGPTATTLGSGKVLVVGGLDTSTYQTVAELYDPTTNSFSFAGSMAVGRRFHAAVLMGDGKVLVAGGSTGSGCTSDATRYDPTTNAWLTTPSMLAVRCGVFAPLSAALLSNGKVLVAGGYDGVSLDLASAEVYDPTTNTWSPVASMSIARSDATATALPDGTVVVAGGFTSNRTKLTATSETYNPTTNSWSSPLAMNAARHAHTSALLGNGKVLVAGGCSDLFTNTALASSELFGSTGATGTACSQGFDCATGFCVNNVCCATTCTPPCQACSVAAGAVANGTCTPLTGPSCDDGNLCTQTDACQSGTCVGGNPVSCPAADPCHQPSMCNPATGTCSSVPKPNGAACDDGNACTMGEACQSGVCTGGSPVTCVASDQCHTPGTCNPVSGCSNPAKADGTPCNDGNLCDLNDVCVSGVCTAGTTVSCPPPDQCHQPSLCNPSTGTCSNIPKPNGTACNDGNACTTGETCQAGACIGGSPVICTASDQCHAAGTCDPVSGCSNPAKPDGTACNDGNACSQIDTCQTGVCTGSNPVVCPQPDACHTSGVCNPATGICSNPVKSDGTACDDGNACTKNEVCEVGACGGGTPVTCEAMDECHAAGICDPINGCSNPAKPDGTPCSMGVCTMGACGPAPDGGTGDGGPSDGGGTGGGGSGGAGTGGASSDGGGTGGGTGGIGTGGTGFGGNGGPDGGFGVPGKSGNCGCRTAPEPGTGGLLLGLGLLAVARRRRNGHERLPGSCSARNSPWSGSCTSARESCRRSPRTTATATPWRRARS